MKEIIIDGITYSLVKQINEPTDKPTVEVNSPFWEAKINIYSWQVGLDGRIGTNLNWTNDNKHLAYKTEKLAKQANDLNKAKWRVRKRIYELNGNEELKFINDKENWSFTLADKKIFSDSWRAAKTYPNWQYLKTEELVEQLIKEMHDDLMTIRSE